MLCRTANVHFNLSVWKTFCFVCFHLFSKNANVKDAFSIFSLAGAEQHQHGSQPNFPCPQFICGGKLLKVESLCWELIMLRQRFTGPVKLIFSSEYGYVMLEERSQTQNETDCHHINLPWWLICLLTISFFRIRTQKKKEIFNFFVAKCSAFLR